MSFQKNHVTASKTPKIQALGAACARIDKVSLQGVGDSFFHLFMSEGHSDALSKRLTLVRCYLAEGAAAEASIGNALVAREYFDALCDLDDALKMSGLKQ